MGGVIDAISILLSREVVRRVFASAEETPGCCFDAAQASAGGARERPGLPGVSGNPRSRGAGVAGMEANVGPIASNAMTSVAESKS